MRSAADAVLFTGRLESGGTVRLPDGETVKADFRLAAQRPAVGADVVVVRRGGVMLLVEVEPL